MGNEIVEGFKFNGEAMDSREIARITGKRHFDVCKDIENQLGQLEGGVRRFSHTHHNTQNGQDYRYFMLPRRECMILATGYSIPLRAKLYDRWEELEAKAAFMLPKNLPDIEFLRAMEETVRIALSAKAEVKTLQGVLEAAQPDIEFSQKYKSADGVYGLKEVAKMVKIPMRKFLDELKQKGYIYRLGKDWAENASPKTRGMFESKPHTLGNGRVVRQLMVTPHGHVIIENLFKKPELSLVFGASHVA